MKKDVYNYLGEALQISAFATPEMYGAKGNGTTDDTAAIQRAVLDKLVCFGAGKTYKVTSPIVVESGTFLELNGATLLCTDKHIFHNFAEGDSYGAYDGNGNITIQNGTIIGGCVSFIHGEGIRLVNIRFRNTLNDHFIEICGCKDYIIDRCSFIGMRNLSGAALEYINIDTNASYPAFPHNKSRQSDTVFYDMTTNQEVTVRDSYFATGEGEYAYGFNAIGVHSRNVESTYAKDVVIVGNLISGFSGCGIRVNAMDNVFVANNKIDVVGDGIRIGDVADAKNIVIQGNFVKAGGSKITKTSGKYANLTVSGNVAEGDTQEF